MSKTKTDVIIDEKVQQVVLEPEPVKVIVLNDDITPVDFVVEILIKIFKHTQESAKEITLKIHTEGSSVVGAYSFEVAEQKTKEAIEESRSRGFPLQVRIE
jgi:ATP-dependent Clp protease adaptor protein ClpS